MDLLAELGPLALGSRLKRLGDRMVAEAAAVYDDHGLAFEPRWFPLVALLERRDAVSVGEAAQALGISQPAVSQFAQQLERAGLLEYAADPNDGRRKLLELSEPGKQELERMKPMWGAVRAAAQDLCDTTQVDLMAVLSRLEDALSLKPLQVRVQEKDKRGGKGQALAQAQAQAQGQSQALPQVEIVPFSPALRHYFKDINLEWVEDMFDPEPCDLEVLNCPEDHILAGGGQIWFAKTDDLGVVGACALRKTNETSFELTKMGVVARSRGRKVGEKLLQHMIKQALATGAENLYLLTNARCEAAIHLYLKNGFVHCAETMAKYGSIYARCDVAMRYRGPGAPVA